MDGKGIEKNQRENRVLEKIWDTMEWVGLAWVSLYRKIYGVVYKQNLNASSEWRESIKMEKEIFAIFIHAVT